VGVVNCRNYCLMGPVIISIEHLMPAKSIEQIKLTQGIDAVRLDDAAANALKDVIEQPADAP
jgi:hypothetical protein